MDNTPTIISSVQTPTREIETQTYSTTFLRPAASYYMSKTNDNTLGI